ncbi:MAG: PIN domain-containing protein [Polyangiaceae bacterium]|nr:PIN domain-containing protein [Polyangiaceae bacterium]
MPGSIIPDTNAFIALLAGDARVAAILDAAGDVLVSAVVLGELTYGALNSRMADTNLARIRALRDECRFAAVDEAVVAAYGRVRLDLKQRGRPIPENDIWIAATAIASGAAVLTRDEHFQEIDGLALMSWT